MHGPKIHICILGGFVSHQLLFGLTDKSSPVNNKSSSDLNCIYNMDACFGCLPWQNSAVPHSLTSSEEDSADERLFTGITAGQESLRYHIHITAQNSSQNKAFYGMLESFPTTVPKGRATSHSRAPGLHHQSSHSPPTSQLASSSPSTRSKRQFFTHCNLSQLEKENLTIAKFNPTQSQPVSHVPLHSPCKKHLPLFLAMSGFQEWGELCILNYRL